MVTSEDHAHQRTPSSDHMATIRHPSIQANGDDSIPDVEDDVMVGGSVGLTLTWKGLSHLIRAKSNDSKGGRYKPILRNVTGIAKPGELLAVMGSSGAGKTTLFDCLSGRQTSGSTSGTICLNGHRVESKQLKNSTAYLQQFELFTGSLTVKEHLTFHAKLRKYVTKEKPEVAVGRLINEFGLTYCANVTIGVPGVKKSLSGGEKKRLAMATQLLGDLPILMCDEPTTGLDSKMAANIVQILLDIARSGKTVICSIHQPSSEVLYMFDRLLLLCDGRTAFFGSTSYALKFFSSIGHRCPDNYNPADFYMKLLSVRLETERQDQFRVQRICDLFEESVHYKRLLMNKQFYQQQNNSVFDMVRTMSSNKACWFVQFWLLLKRSAIDSLRNPAIHKLRIFQKIILALVVGLCFMNIKLNQHGITASLGALFIFVTENTFPSMYGVIQVFPSELPLILRENKDGLYRIDAYYLSKIISLIPAFVFDSCLFVSIAYWIVGFSAKPEDFFLTVLVAILTSNVASACGCMFSAVFGSIPLAMMCLVPFDYILMISAGIFVQISSIPLYASWLKILSWFHYSLEANAVVQWRHVTNITCEEDQEIPCLHDGHQVLEYYDFDQNDLWWDIAALAVLYASFHAIGFSALVVRSYKK